MIKGLLFISVRYVYGFDTGQSFEETADMSTLNLALYSILNCIWCLCFLIIVFTLKLSIDTIIGLVYIVIYPTIIYLLHRKNKNNVN